MRYLGAIRIFPMIISKNDIPTWLRIRKLGCVTVVKFFQWVVSRASKGRGSKLTLTRNLGRDVVEKVTAMLALDISCAYISLISTLFETECACPITGGSIPERTGQVPEYLLTSLVSCFTQRKVKRACLQLPWRAGDYAAWQSASNGGEPQGKETLAAKHCPGIKGWFAAGGNEGISKWVIN